MNLSQQMQAQIALNKALPQIQMQLSSKDVAMIDYQDGLQELLIQNGFDVSYCQRECQLVIKFKKNRGGFWSDR
jgi:membrane protease subunit (stomatin/prohibitin family)